MLLVLARTPGVNQWFAVADFFRVALVVHVDLSVGVWFAALAGMLWSLNTTERLQGWSWAALGLCGFAAVVAAAAPLNLTWQCEQKKGAAWVPDGPTSTRNFPSLLWFERFERD